jgi:hypothetical protein
MSYIGLSNIGLGTLGSKIPGDSPRSEETELQEKVATGVVVSVLDKPKPDPEPYKVEQPEQETAELKKPKAKPKPKPGVTDSLKHAFRHSRKLYPREVAYIKEIFGPSMRYDKVRITRDHWFAYGSTRVTGNTINFASFYAGEAIFEDTPEEHLTQAGLDLLGHEAMHVWQYQNGGWAYAGDALAKQSAGFYSTGSRNTAYDWQTAVEWEIPWKNWGPEQQAQAIDDWNLAKRKRKSGSGAAVSGGKELVEKLQPYADKVKKGQGATQFSIPGTLVCVLVASGIGYLIKKCPGAQYGAAFGVLINLPWQKWCLKKPGLSA